MDQFLTLETLSFFLCGNFSVTKVICSVGVGSTFDARACSTSVSISSISSVTLVFSIVALGFRNYFWIFIKNNFLKPVKKYHFCFIGFLPQIDTSSGFLAIGLGIGLFLGLTIGSFLYTKIPSENEVTVDETDTDSIIEKLQEQLNVLEEKNVIYESGLSSMEPLLKAIMDDIVTSSYNHDVIEDGFVTINSLVSYLFKQANSVEGSSESLSSPLEYFSFPFGFELSSALLLLIFFLVICYIISTILLSSLGSLSYSIGARFYLFLFFAGYVTSYDTFIFVSLMFLTLFFFVFRLFANFSLQQVNVLSNNSRVTDSLVLFCSKLPEIPTPSFSSPRLSAAKKLSLENTKNLTEDDIEEVKNVKLKQTKK